MKRQGTTPPDKTFPERIITYKELATILPFTRQTIWTMVHDGRFPKPIQLSEERVGWRWSVIEKWLVEREKRPLERRRYFGKPAPSRKSSPRRDEHPDETERA